MRRLFDEEMEDLKLLILDGESPVTKLGQTLQDHEYVLLQMYINGEAKEILDMITTLCEAELHRMTAEVILWRE
jgi:hypothetical protein